MKKGDVFWVLNNLLILRSGDWPDPEWYEFVPITRIQTLRAKFIGPCEAAAEVENRLNMCGLDGFLVKQVYAWGESYNYLTLNLRLSYKEIEKGVRSSLNYITGKWPKRRYHEYKNKKRGGIL